MMAEGQKSGPDYEAAWRALSEPRAWMQGHPKLNAYLGLNLADIANDLIAAAYPELAPAIRAARTPRG